MRRRHSNAAVWHAALHPAWFGLACLEAGLAVPAARADGGVIRFSERLNGYQLTVFSQPTPLRVGRADLSVLVQDAASAAPNADARVILTLWPRGGGLPLRQEATRAAATNKLLRAALFDLPAPGWYEVTVDVAGPHGPARARLNLLVEPPPPRWVELWFWIALPIGPIALYAVKVSHRERRLRFRRGLDARLRR